jgi:uncharacterized protein YxjI
MLFEMPSISLGDHMSDFSSNFYQTSHLLIKQKVENWELLGFETRNRYAIYDDSQTAIAYAAEQGKGFWASLSRMIVKHWRAFDIFVFNQNKEVVFTAHHPFRWFFQCLTLITSDGQKIGSIEQKFAFLYKSFDILDENEQVIFRISSGLFSIWKFEIRTPDDKMIARIDKNWSGFLSEIFTDKDNFTISFLDHVKPNQRKLLLATVLLVDLVYFENNHQY